MELFRIDGSLTTSPLISWRGKGRFVGGLPSKEDLMKNYWKSINTLEEFLKNMPFNNPELYIFEKFPAKIK